MGGLPDVVADGKTGYVVETKNSTRLAESVIRFYSGDKEKKLVENIRKEAYQFSWAKMTEAITQLFV